MSRIAESNNAEAKQLEQFCKQAIAFITFENYIAVAEQEENRKISHETVSEEGTSESPEAPQTVEVSTEGEAETAKEATEEQT